MAEIKAANQLHSVMRVRQNGSVVLLQPFRGPDVAGATLAVDLARGTVELKPNQDKIEFNYRVAFGVAALAPLAAGHALVLVLAGEKVGYLRENLVWQLQKAEVVVDKTPTSADLTKLNNEYIVLLRDAFDPRGSGRGLFFSFDADVTLTQQRFAALAAEGGGGKSLHARADVRFLWNGALIKPLVEGGAARFAVPMMLASFHQMTGIRFGDYEATITLIGRRGAQRAGVRHWRRGADAQGNVANFVETEQMIEMTSPKGNILSSFVQVRGSIPIMWSQIPNIKYKPTTRIAPPDVFAKAFDRHVTNLLDIYKDRRPPALGRSRLSGVLCERLGRAAQDVDAINLVNQHGSEGLLADRFQEQADRFTATKGGFRLIPFDFHKVCGATSYHKLSLLWDQIEGDFERWGFYAEGGKEGPVRQGGAFRTNCIDCLDRTNVVQGMLGRKHLEHVLRRADLLPPGTELQTAFPAVFNQFRVIWADHGDDVSRQYAGTGALKSGFTRTGKRTKGGLLNDGVKSLTRYYLNNFQDGAKQDAIDYATGNYAVKRGAGSPFKEHRSPTLPLLAALLSLLWGLTMAVQLLLTVLLPLVVGGVTLRSVLARGADLVRQPQLCPDLSQPW